MPLWKIARGFEVVNLQDGKQFQWWAGAAEIGVKPESRIIRLAPTFSPPHKEMKLAPAVSQRLTRDTSRGSSADEK